MHLFEYIPIVILYGSITAGWACFMVNRRRIFVVPNLVGSFLAFGACLEVVSYVFAVAALSRGITEVIPLQPMMNIHAFIHGAAAVDMVLLSFGWYALCYAVRWLYARSRPATTRHA